jgi:hypothetical protein
MLAAPLLVTLLALAGGHTIPEVSRRGFRSNFALTAHLEFYMLEILLVNYQQKIIKLSCCVSVQRIKTFFF